MESEKGEIELIVDELRETFSKRLDIQEVKQKLLNKIKEFEEVVVGLRKNDSIAASKVLFQIGYGYLEMQNDLKAKELFEECISLDPSNVKFVYQLHFVHIYLRDYTKSISLLDECAKIDPKNEEKYYLRASKILSSIKNDSKAIEYLEKCLKKERKHDVIVELLRIHLSNDEVDKALTIIEEEKKSKTTLSDQEKRDFHYYTGLCMKTCGKKEEAIQSFQSALSIQPDDALSHEGLLPLFDDDENKEKAEAEMKILRTLKESGKVPKDKILRTSFTIGTKKVLGFEFFTLTKTYVGWGNMQGKLQYLFLILNPELKKIEYRISLGSYDSTNLFAIQGQSRLYHLDGYYPSRHVTYGMFSNGAPSWYEIKEKVKGIVQNQVTQISSLTINNNNNNKSNNDVDANEKSK